MNEKLELKNNRDEIIKKENNLEIKIIGWAGSILIITAYSLNSLGYISAENIIYQILNLFGAILLAIRVFSDREWSMLFLEVFWGAIAVVSLIKYFTF